MVHGSGSLRLVALGLKLAAWGLTLASLTSIRLVLEAWRLGPVSVGPGPRFMDLVNKTRARPEASVFSVSGM